MLPAAAVAEETVADPLPLQAVSAMAAAAITAAQLAVAHRFCRAPNMLTPSALSSVTTADRAVRPVCNTPRPREWFSEGSGHMLSRYPLLITVSTMPR